MFNKNKKPDHRIVYQTRGFKNKLRSARGYKRPPRQLPKNPLENILRKIGLGSWWSRAASLATLFLLIYLVFIPNLFFIKQVSVGGADASTDNEVQKIIADFLTKHTPWPQQNLLLLSKGKLSNYILSNDQKILSVDSIKKSIPDHLAVNITPRIDNFLFETSSSTAFTVSNDGLVTGELFINASTSMPGGLMLIKLTDGSDYLAVGQNAITQNTANSLYELQSKLPGIIKSPLNYYSMDNLKSTSINAVTHAGFSLQFGLNNDIEKQLNRLALLFAQFSPDEINKLYYVDMRFMDKAYVCELKQPCVNPITLPTSSGTTTPAFNTTTPQTVN